MIIGRRATVLTIVAAIGFATACGGATAGYSDETDASSDSATSARDPSCPGLGRARRGPAPSGPCSSDAVCEFRDPAAECGPNDRFYPAQKEWRCTCPEGSWACEVIGGSLKGSECDSHDGGPDADATAIVDASDSES